MHICTKTLFCLYLKEVWHLHVKNTCLVKRKYKIKEIFDTEIFRMMAKISLSEWLEFMFLTEVGENLANTKTLDCCLEPASTNSSPETVLRHVPVTSLLMK